MRCFGVTILLFFLSNVPQSQAKLSQAYEAGLIERVKSLRPAQSGVVLAGAEGLPRPLCGTPIALEANYNYENLSSETQSVLAQYLARPTTGVTQITPLGFIRVHYDTASGDVDRVPSADVLPLNGIPDFIDDAMTVLDSVWLREIVDLGYRKPLVDGTAGGDSLLDVYFQQLGPSYLGQTFVDVGNLGPQRNQGTAYVELDNDYVFPQYPTPAARQRILRVTAAHEFFHAVQFAYDIREFEFTDPGNSSTFRPYWYEMSSTWMEDIVYDTIDDYHSLVKYVLRYPWLSFRTFSYNPSDTAGVFHPYAQALWNHYLVARFADTTLIRTIWTLCGAVNGFNFFPAVNQALSAKMSSFLASFREYCIWNYYTGSREVPGKYYRLEGESFPVGAFVDTLPQQSVIVGDAQPPVQDLGCTYYFIVPNASQPDSFQIFFTVLSGAVAQWDIAGFGRDTTGDTVFISFMPVGAASWLARYPAWKTFTDQVVLPIALQEPIDATIGNYGYHYVFGFQGPPPASDQFSDPYPNPIFLPQQTTVRFKVNLARDAQVEFSVHDLSGQVIHEERPKKFLAGVESFLTWDGLNDEQQMVASGVYLCAIRVGDKTKVFKLAVVR